MRKSVAVTLVLSGSLLAGCGDRQNNDSVGAGEPLTNNTYHVSHGYYHSYYREWYPWPHNYYDAQRGYFYGGSWSSVPDVKSTTPSLPRGGVAGTSSSRSSSGISRFGFGSHGSSAS